MLEEDFEKELNNTMYETHLAEMTKAISTVKQRAQSMLHDRNELLKLISCLDLTALNADDTNAAIERIIDKALLPYPMDTSIRCAAVCVYPARISGAKYYISSKQQNLPIDTVAAGFPSGQYRIESKLLEVKLAIEDGAEEIDVVISRDAVLEHQWIRLYDEIVALKSTCGQKCMKTILATGELENEQNIYRASWVAMRAGSDFIKTSTGKEKVNATLEAAYVMCHAIKQFHSLKGKKIGFKAAGGIRLALEALEYRVMVEDVLGTEWLKPRLFRIGASSLLDDVLKELNK